MIDEEKFVLICLNKFKQEYNIDEDLIEDIIRQVLIDASNVYFSYDLIQENEDLCIKCGKCCENLNCEYFNGETCDNYEDRYSACKEYPGYDIFDRGLVWDVSCNFALELAYKIIDDEIKKNMELMGLN